MIDLYHVGSNVKAFRGHRDICLDWFVVDRERPVAPYAELIVGYGEPLDHCYCNPRTSCE